jgi:alanine racemase
VLIRGRRYRIAGTVTMDHLMVDLGADLVEPGDEVVMLGTQGAEAITAQEVADALGTIPYEVVCGIGARVPRVYTGV